MHEFQNENNSPRFCGGRKSPCRLILITQRLVLTATVIADDLKDHSSKDEDKDRQKKIDEVKKTAAMPCRP